MLIELTLKNRPISYSHFTSILYDFECYLFRTVPIVCLSNSFLCFIVSLLILIWEYFLPVLIGIKLGILDFFLVYHFGHTHTHTHTHTNRYTTETPLTEGIRAWKHWSTVWLHCYPWSSLNEVLHENWIHQDIFTIAFERILYTFLFKICWCMQPITQMKRYSNKQTKLFAPQGEWGWPLN